LSLVMDSQDENGLQLDSLVRLHSKVVIKTYYGLFSLQTFA